MSNDPHSEIEHPDDRKQVMHRFGCGHTMRAWRRTVRLRGAQDCPDCYRRQREAEAPERRRRRRRELAEEAAKFGPRPQPSTAQRHAQRVIVALMQPGGAGRSYLDPQTRQLRIIDRHGDAGISLQEVGAHLDTLKVPFQMSLAAPPVGRTRSRNAPRFELAIAPEDRLALLIWVPSLAAKIDRAEARLQADGGGAPQP